MDFVFIAVNYNGFNFTKDYIESINNLTINDDDTINIVIVDNNSKLIEKEKLEDYTRSIRNVEIIFLNDNLGYFGGINAGLDLFNSKDNKIFIVGNNDLTFTNDFIINYKKLDLNNNVDVIAPNIITKDGYQQNPHVINEVSAFDKFKAAIYNSHYYVGMPLRILNQTFKKILNVKPNKTNNYQQMVIKRGIGACYILTSNFFNKFQRLDNKVFMWGEEAILSKQIEEGGGVTLYVPSLKITHHESATVNNIPTRKRYEMVRDSYKTYRDYL